MTRDEQEFVERVGRHFEADGVPRIGGRLYGFLLLRDEPCSLEELADSLSVSKASVSTNARLLVQWRVVDRVPRPGDRRDFYKAAADLSSVLELRLQRIHEMTDILRFGATATPPNKPTAAHRLERMAAFNTRAGDLLEILLADWPRPAHDPADTDPPE